MSEASRQEAELARSRRVAEQFRASCRVWSLLSPLVLHTAEHEDLEALSQRTETGFNALVLLEGKAQVDALDQVEAGAQKFERLLEGLDAQIPMGWFREHFDASRASSVALADYAMILGKNAGTDPRRLDRIQFLLTRLVSFFVSAEDDSPALRRQLLTEALPPSTLETATREAVVSFCRDAVRRLGAFARLKDLIDSGFFVDVRGYKLSLRHQLLDPDVMAAIIELNEATTDTLDRLAEAEQQQEQQPGKALEDHLAEVDLRIKAIFKQVREDETERTQKFEAWLKQSAAARKVGKRPTAADYMAIGINRREDKRLLLGGIALVLTLIFIFRFPSSADLEELSPAQCAQLSPLVTSGATAPARAPKIFIGRVDKGRWGAMDPAGRREAALELAHKVAARGWTGATVMLDDQVVMQIEAGNVLVVQ